MLLTKEVEVKIGHGGKTAKTYEDKGYVIPRKLIKKKYCIPKDATIKVKIEDLAINSSLKVEYECDKCHDIVAISYANFYRSQQLHDFNKLTYCVHCTASVYNSGKNHYMYNENLSEEHRQDKRESTEYSEFHRLVLKRDNYTCQCCGYRNSHKRDMIVHHLYSYDTYKDLRTDVTNGITLCKNCHKNFHAKYGSGNNTKEQFEEWLPFALKNLEYNETLIPTKVAYCIEDDEIIISVGNYCKIHHNIKPSYIYRCCNNYQTQVFGKHYRWYDDWINMTQQDKDKYFLWCEKKSKTGTQGREVVNLDTKTVYYNLSTAIQYTHPNASCGTFSNRIKEHKLVFGEKWEYVDECNIDISNYKRAGKYYEIE
jgi:5-methylcytosine-specific restriction endonuclease McrA